MNDTMKCRLEDVVINIIRVAMFSCTSRPYLRHQAAFSLVELLTVIVVIGILAAILVPAVSAIRNQSLASSSISNLRQITQGAMLYANDHQGYLPLNQYTANMPSVLEHPETGGNYLWQGILHPYLVGRTIKANNDASMPSGEEWLEAIDPVFLDPVYHDTDAYLAAPWIQGFGMNTHLYRMNHISGGAYSNGRTNGGSPENPPGAQIMLIQQPAKTILLGTHNNFNLQVLANRYDAFVNSGGATRYAGNGHYAFVDGRIESLSPDEVEKYFR